MLLPDIALKNSITLLFLSFFLFISCDHKHKEYAKGVLFYSGFPHERELIGEVIELDTALLRYPFRIRIEGDRVIVMDLHGLDHYGHLFQYPSYQYLSSFGKRGDSPTEMLSLENFRWFFVKFGGNLFFISMVFLFFFLNPIKSCRYVCFLVTLKTPHH